MINSEISNDVIVCSFEQSNKLNALISENVKYEIGRHYEKAGTKVILDLGNILFVDSSGFGALLSVMKKARSNKGIFKICNIAPDVMALFKLLQLHTIFEIYENRKECLESFN